MQEKTIFSKIIDGDVPCEFLYEDELCICIKDLHPQAPTHVLLIPKKAIPKVADATADDMVLLGHLMLKVGDITRMLGIDDAFRVVINNGEKAGQTVFHLHLHILGNTVFQENSLGLK